MIIKNVLIDKAETDREDRTSSSHNSIYQTQPLLEIVSKDGERRCVNQWGPCSKHEAIGQIEDRDVVVKGGWESHPRSGEDGSNDGGQPEAYFVTAFVLVLKAVLRINLKTWRCWVPEWNVYEMYPRAQPRQIRSMIHYV